MRIAHGYQLVEPHAAIALDPTVCPETPECSAHPPGLFSLRVALVDEPPQGGAKVVVLAPQACKRLPLTCEHAARGVFAQPDEEVRMPAVLSLTLAVLVELRQRVLPQCLEHPEPSFFGIILDDNQRFIDKSGVEVRSVPVVQTVPNAYLFSCLQRPASSKHTEPSKEALLRLRKQVIAPIHHGFQALQPFRERSTPTAENLKSVRQLVFEFLHGQCSGSRGGELDVQWNAVQPFANSLDAIRFAFSPVLVDVPPRGPLQEQANGTPESQTPLEPQSPLTCADRPTEVLLATPSQRRH